MRRSKIVGFTIVELLVVIVVISILAVISVVSYIGITQKANDTYVKSELSSAAKQLELYKVENGFYPSANDCLTPGIGKICLSSKLVSYIASNQNSSYALTAQKGDISYGRTESLLPFLLINGAPKDGLALYLNVDNPLSYSGSGSTTWKDLSGNNNNGVINGGVAYSSDANDTWLAFNGSSGYVRVANNTTINNINNDLTITFRVSGVTSTTGYLLAKNSVDASNMQYSLFTEVYTGGGINKVNFKSYFNGLMKSEYKSSIPTFSSDWHNVSVVFSQVGTVTNVKYYLDGELVQDKDQAYFSITSNTNDLLVGKRDGGVYFNGKISNLLLYNRALGQGEISIINKL